MKTWLNNIYLAPDSHRYAFFSFLQQYYKRLMLVIILLINSYPTFRYIYYTQQAMNAQQQLNLLTENITQQEKLLQSLRSKKADNQHKDQHFTEINRQIKQIAELHQAKIDNIQWQFEKGKQVYLVLSQTSQSVFELVQALDQLNALYFNELVLIKLNQAPLIQLQAQLSFE